MPYMHHNHHAGSIVGKEAAAFRASIEHAALGGLQISHQKKEDLETHSHHLAHPDVTLEEQPEEEPQGSVTSVKWRRRWKKTANRIPIAACVMNFHRWWLVVLLVGLWMITGMLLLGFEVGENMGVLDAAYVLAQIATTIGYGDVAPQSSDKMKMFLSIHALLGIVVVATVLAAVVQEVMRSSQEVLARRLQAKTHSLSRFHLDELPEWEGHLLQTISGTLYAFGIMMAFLLGGMLFYGTVESCTCGRRSARVEGCEDDRCEETGGYQKSFLDAWYMSCISLTTVGFGDFSPQSSTGRAFAIFWMIFGVVAVANFQFEASKWLMHSDTMSKILNTDLDAVFDEIDRDQNGRLERHEFMVFALLEGGLVERSTLVGIQQLFDELDADKNGTVSREEIQGFFARQREQDARRFAAKRKTAAPGSRATRSEIWEDDPIVVTASPEPQNGAVVGRRVLETE